MTFLSIFHLSGCFHAVIVQPSSIQQDNDDKIVVTLTDGTLVAFEGGDYKLEANANGDGSLTGSGKKYRDGQSEYKSFEGSIPLDEVKTIKKSETTPWFYITIGTAVLFIAAGIALAIALDGGLGH